MSKDDWAIDFCKIKFIVIFSFFIIFLFFWHLLKINYYEEREKRKNNLMTEYCKNISFHISLNIEFSFIQTDAALTALIISNYSCFDSSANWISLPSSSHIFKIQNDFWCQQHEIVNFVNKQKFAYERFFLLKKILSNYQRLIKIIFPQSKIDLLIFEEKIQQTSLKAF